ncbi:unnamed protein product [Closterium sp. Naga37s-1]|nr:unnamed protein product [Closterium sp. Naga37s-1]
MADEVAAAVPRVVSQLNDLGAFPSATWVEGALRHIVATDPSINLPADTGRGVRGLARDGGGGRGEGEEQAWREVVTRCMALLLLTDLRAVSSNSGCLPGNVHAMHDQTLRGSFLLQVGAERREAGTDELTRLTRWWTYPCPSPHLSFHSAPLTALTSPPCVSPLAPPGGRGGRHIRAPQVDEVVDISVPLSTATCPRSLPPWPPAARQVILRDVLVRRGLLLLLPELVQVLGGHVAHLEAARCRIADHFSRPSRPHSLSRGRLSSRSTLESTTLMLAQEVAWPPDPAASAAAPDVTTDAAAASGGGASAPAAAAAAAAAATAAAASGTAYAGSPGSNQGQYHSRYNSTSAAASTTFAAAATATAAAATAGAAAVASASPGGGINASAVGSNQPTHAHVAPSWRDTSPSLPRQQSSYPQRKQQLETGAQQNGFCGNGYLGDGQAGGISRENGLGERECVVVGVKEFSYRTPGVVRLVVYVDDGCSLMPAAVHPAEIARLLHMDEAALLAITHAPSLPPPFRSALMRLQAFLASFEAPTQQVSVPRRGQWGRSKAGQGS